jgi:catechol 2,3-dioxygenase-like lactoylglutathione lyase family enzyme
MQTLSLVSVVVSDYDEAIAFYRDSLGFRLTEDTQIDAHKRWVVVKPPGVGQTGLLLAKASNAKQATAIGQQSGGRVFLFLHTDDLNRDYNAYKSRGVVFVRQPETMPYGKVAVFQDLYGNLWDLIEPAGD